jgi:quercetin dioxygenase-like cupin family protein
MSGPYMDYDNVRVFQLNKVDESDLVWHTDEENRLITVLEGEGWRFQRDNELPIELSKGDKLKIPEGQIHRILKGSTDLIIKIEK